MAELNDDASAASNEVRLLARVAELEVLLEARRATIIALAAQLAEHQGASATFGSTRLADAERQLAELRATKLFRYAAVPRRLYARARFRG